MLKVFSQPTLIVKTSNSPRISFVTLSNSLTLILICLALLNPVNALQKQITKESELKLPERIIAGEVHYSRIPVQYWEHRLLTIKSMGFNALSVYIMWNYHQASKGKFDYHSQNKNLPLFLQLAQKHGFYVLIRPGPYVCAQWDFGGFPARLLNIKGLKLRANNQIYLSEVREYFQSLAPILNPYLAIRKGPIILLQIQNEYGFYGNDKTFFQRLIKMWKDLKVECQFYYVDNLENIQNSHWQGANIGVNSKFNNKVIQQVRKMQKTGFIFGGEIYSGWLTHWGQLFNGKSLTRFTREFKDLLSSNLSFSMYMAHGGTNFGLTAGGHDKIFWGDYKGHITSYDYDAPINEQGSQTAKFTRFRDLAKKYVSWVIPEPPLPIPTITISAFTPKNIASLFANLPQPSVSKSQQTFLFQSDQLQMYNQGLVVYQTNLSEGIYLFNMIIHDFAVVYLEDQFLGSYDRSNSVRHLFGANCRKSSCKLTILVEAMGHINFDHSMENDRKGLVSFEDIKKTKFLWNIYKINVDQKILDWQNFSEKRFPSLLKATFQLDVVGDTYFVLKNYKKGYVWVNGHNLGRYWNKGPSSRLFCPGVWLKKGKNAVFILDILSNNQGEVRGERTLKQ